MFKDTTSPVPLEEKDYVISPSPPEVSPQIDSRNLPTSFKPFGNQGFGNPVASQCSLQMVWVQLRPQCCSGSGEKHLLRTGAGAWACSAKKAVSTSSWNHAPSPGTVLVFFSQPLTSLCHMSPYGEKKSRGISCSLTTKEFWNYVLWSSKEYVLLQVHLLILDQEM